MTEIETLWNEILDDASQLEVFEPRLSGFRKELEEVANGKEISNSWLNKVESHLNGEVVEGIGYKLNQIAEQHFSINENADAKRVSFAALLIYRLALGADHPHTKVINENYKKIPNPLKASSTTLPRVWNFNKKSR